MTIRFQTVRLNKRYPLQISRGTSTGSNNLMVFVNDGEHEGIGECAPGTGFDDTLSLQAETQLRSIVDAGMLDAGPNFAWAKMKESGIDPAAMAGLDIALWDLIGKRAGLPLQAIFGLPKPSIATSVTVGINPIEVLKERVPEILARTQARFLKIKLGNPEGLEADEASYETVREVSTPFQVGLRVDANGGWTADQARKMMAWLSQRGCDYVEQPLEAGREAELPMLFKDRTLPLFLDESVRTSLDVPKVWDRCDGVNLKLMKTGGLTEALRLVAVARAHGLKTMIGCMGETSISIAAGASIGGLFDHIDLDSHLNLAPDPATGTQLINGVVMTSGRPGHGAALIEE